MADEINAGKITFDFSADLSDLHKAFADAKHGLNDLAGSVTKGTSSMDNFGQAASVAGGVLLAEVVMGAVKAAQAIASFAFVVTKSSSEAVEGLERVAGQTGLTIQQLQELQPVFARNNLSAQSMGQVFRILARNMQEAKDPTSQATKAFRELGINISGLESSTEVFTLIAERISKLPDGFQKTRLETELLGRSGTQLNAVLSQGAEGLRQSAAEARAMGNVLNDEANTALLNVNDSFDDLDVAQANLEKHLGVLFAPFIQGLNEARKLTIDFATKAIDQVIIATRTLHARFMGLWGFLKEAASLSITEWGKLPEIWAKWSTQTEQQIAKIREIGVVAKASADSVGKINTAAQAAGNAMVAAADKSSMALTQLDMGWAIVEKALTRYRLTQKGIIDAGDAEVTHLMASTTALLSMAAAGNKADAAVGSISPVQFAQQNADLALKGVVAQQVAERARLQFVLDGLSLEQSAHQKNTNEWLTLQQKKDAASKASYAQLAVLDTQLNTAIITGVAEVTAAQQRMRDTELSAATSMASSNLKILEAQFATTDDLRAGRLAVIQAQLDQELNAVGLAESQKTALIRKAEAEKIAVSSQYPTFYERQLQSLVNSNSFSISQITTAWTSGLANAIVNGGDFVKAAWQQTQIALVQGTLNTSIQLAAEWGLRMARQAGLIATSTAAELTAYTTLESAKTAAATAGEAARLGIVKASNALMAASMIATLGAMMTMGTAAITIMGTVMGAVASMMAAIAAALAAGIVTAPLAGPVAAAAGILTAAAATMTAASLGAVQAAGGAAIVAASSAGLFAKGGIVTGPTLGLMGEAGSAEAAIPLNDRGAAFMAKTMGLSRGAGTAAPTQQTIVVELNGAPIMKMVANGLPSMLRLKGLPA